MQEYLLSLLIFTPLIAALAALVMPSRLEKYFRPVALAASLVQLLVLTQLLITYEPLQTLQFVEQKPWIILHLGSWGILKAEYFVAIDGLNIVFVCLTVVIMFIAAIASWPITKNIKGYFVLLLILNAAIVGTFTALDFLLFYLFFEFMLLPMFFLIGMWGGPRREYASIKFFLYTLLGSILILIALAGMKFLHKITIPRVLGSAVGASVIFFIVSNFGVWLTSPMYPLNLGGLAACYTAAIPFFHNTLAGDIVYCATLFGAFEYLKYKTPGLVRAEATV
jgi:NADH:ubiquinone oxidoreductase subunit 4 (subunit M)